MIWIFVAVAYGADLAYYYYDYYTQVLPCAGNAGLR